MVTVADAVVNDQVLPVEVFAAKDIVGNVTGVMLSAPCRSGLKQADTLRVDGSLMLAIRQRSILPIDLPSLSADNQTLLRELAAAGQRLAVAEFTPLGLLDAYFLTLDIVG
jgi:hypothetical protein